ncbi:MAG: transporter substrate-binding domain-containing protein [Alphaproteobacteria bacterium]|nr:transporter substrate-binding domain-containing protein [Alphaproteobacteria bacterium]
MRRLLALAVAVIAVATVTPQGPAVAETLRVGTECTYHPFNFRDENGELQGYDIDVAKAIGEHLGVEIEFHCQKWDGMIPALLANKFDLIVASMSITDERKQKIDFSDPYRVSIGQFIGAKEKDLMFFNEDGSVNEAGFEGVKIGLQRATTYDNWIQARAPNAEVVRYDAIEALYLDLQNGRVDAIMTNPMNAYLKFLSQPEGAGFEVVGPQIEETEFFGIGVGVGLRKGNDELLSRINEGIRQVTEDGSLEVFARKHFPFTIHPQKWQGTE